MDSSNNAIEIFNKFAGQYQEKYMEQELYRDSLDLFSRNLKTENPRVLDLCCGPGNITRYLLDKRQDLDIVGTDLSENMLELAQKNNPEANFCQMDCREVYRMEGRFDGIICGFGLPYLSREEAIGFIDACYNLLKPSGTLYLSTMEADHSRSGFVSSSSGEEEGLYTYYHEAEYLTDALEKTGFHLILLQRLDNPNQKDEQIKDLILIAGK